VRYSGGVDSPTAKVLDPPVDFTPSDIIEVIKLPERYQRRFSRRTFSTSASELNEGHKAESLAGDFRLGIGSFFGFDISGGASHETASSNMLDLFEKFSLDMKVLRVRFNRPWFPASMVYAMQDTYLANYKKGAISNGEPYGDLRGSASIIPESVILAQDIKLTYSGRKET
jgi:hypothetical protein